MPITWRNVGNTVSASESSGSSMRGAQDSFKGGFDALQKVLDNRKSTNSRNFGTGQENTVADYLDRVAQANSMEDVAGLQDDSQLAALRGQLTGKYQGQVRGAIDDRETGLIEQIGARDEFSDDQTNRDLRPQLQAAYAKLYNGDESGLADLQALGVADDGEALAAGFGALDKASRLDIAQDGNARGWNQDARAQQDQAFANYERARVKDGNELSDREDAIMRQGYQEAQNLPEGTDMSSFKRAFQDSLVDAGSDPTRAASLAENLDGSVTARENASAMDTKAFDQASSQIDKHYRISNNEFNQELPSDPQQAANDILRKFENEDGELPGGGDPEERRQFAEEAGELMRRGVEVDGIVYPVTPALMEAAMSGTGDVFWDDRPVDAMHDFIKNSPEVQKRFEEFQSWQADSSAMQETFNESVGSGYESDYSKQAAALIEKRRQEAEGGALKRSSEKARSGRSAEGVNDRIQFR